MATAAILKALCRGIIIAATFHGTPHGLHTPVQEIQNYCFNWSFLCELWELCLWVLAFISAVTHYHELSVLKQHKFTWEFCRSEVLDGDHRTEIWVFGRAACLSGGSRRHSAFRIIQFGRIQFLVMQNRGLFSLLLSAGDSASRGCLVSLAGGPFLHLQRQQQQVKSLASSKSLLLFFRLPIFSTIPSASLFQL